MPRRATRLARTFRLWDVVVEGAHDFVVHLSKEGTEGARELITDDGNMICDAVDAGAECPVCLDCLEEKVRERESSMACG